jgi:hypothetical protein
MLFRGKNRVAIFNTRISNYPHYPTRNFRVTRMPSLNLTCIKFTLRKFQKKIHRENTLCVPSTSQQILCLIKFVEKIVLTFGSLNRFSMKIYDMVNLVIHILITVRLNGRLVHLNGKQKAAVLFRL